MGGDGTDGYMTELEFLTYLLVTEFSKNPLTFEAFTTEPLRPKQYMNNNFFTRFSNAQSRPTTCVKRQGCRSQETTK